MTESCQESLADSDVCLIDNGDYLYVFVGSKISDSLCYSLFGYENFGFLKHYGLESLSNG